MRDWDDRLPRLLPCAPQDVDAVWEAWRDASDELAFAKRFRAIYGWDHWPTEEQMQEFETAHAAHMEHVRLYADFVRNHADPGRGDK